MVESLLHGFCPHTQNPNVGEAPGGFAQEDGLSLVRLDQRDLAVWPGDGNRKAGKARSRTDVCDAQFSGGKVRRQE